MTLGIIASSIAILAFMARAYANIPNGRLVPGGRLSGLETLCYEGS